MGPCGVSKTHVDRALSELVQADRIVATRKGRGDGYEPCPDHWGTLGHGPERSPGGSVPGEGEPPVGGSPAGTLRDLKGDGVPDGHGGALEDRRDVEASPAAVARAVSAPKWAARPRPGPPGPAPYEPFSKNA